MSKEVFFYVPEIFDPSLIPQLDGLHDEAYWFLHKIISLQICYKHHTSEWVNISRQTIRQFIHARHATRVRSSLLAQKVIECNEKYLPGSHSKGYRLAQPYRCDMRRVRITKPVLVAKMLRHRIRYEDKPIEESKLAAVHQHLLGWLRRVRIDTTKAYGIINALPDQPKAKKLGSRKRCKMVKGYRKALNRVTVDQIADGCFDYVVCQQGRVHTPITRLFTDARSCLSIEGKPLASIDIANSQLIFFTLLFLENQYNRQARDTDGKEMSREVAGTSLPCQYSRFSSPSGSIANPTSTAVVSAISSPSGSTMGDEDSERFVSLVMEGGIYEYLMEKCRGFGECIGTRKKFKTLFFQQVLYGDNCEYYASQLPLPVLFQTEFPAVWEFILQQKMWNGRGARGEAFKKLAVRMQQRESRYMIGQVCTRLMEHHPEIPLLTIHDSILTTPEHMPTVQRVMTEEFARLGVEPTLRVE